MKTKVTLYIATHNKYPIKYFGKTTIYHTQEELQQYYHGSGKYWKDVILEMYGDDVTMEIYGTYHIDEVKEIAIKFSEDNNIVESKEWANMMNEDGFTGGGLYGKYNGMYGKKHSEKSIEKMRTIKKGKKVSDETKKKMSESSKGSSHSVETRKKLSELKSGKNHHMYGKKHSDESKRKISEGASGVNNARYGHKMSDEEKNKISQVRKNNTKYITCPHCNRKGDKSNMIKHHFDKCYSITKNKRYDVLDENDKIIYKCIPKIDVLKMSQSLVNKNEKNRYKGDKFGKFKNYYVIIY